VGRRLRTACLILCFQQLQGINLLIYFSTIIFSNVGLSMFLSSLLAAVMNTMLAAGCWITPWVVERGGRRRIMLWSSVLLTIFMLIFVVMVNLGDKTSDATQWTAIAMAVAFCFMFGFGWTGIPWLYGPEVSLMNLWPSESIPLIRLDCAASLPTSWWRF
jgi:MFS family permease